MYHYIKSANEKVRLTITNLSLSRGGKDTDVIAAYRYKSCCFPILMH